MSFLVSFFVIFFTVTFLTSFLTSFFFGSAFIRGSSTTFEFSSKAEIPDWAARLYIYCSSNWFAKLAAILLASYSAEAASASVVTPLRTDLSSNDEGVSWIVESSSSSFCFYFFTNFFFGWVCAFFTGFKVIFLTTFFFDAGGAFFGYATFFLGAAFFLAGGLVFFTYGLDSLNYYFGFSSLTGG